VEVEVSNAKDMWIDPKKMIQKSYARHSGYPGGLTLETVAKTIEKKGAKEVLKKAVYGMLPKNKLRPRMMKNLVIND
jgi:large subunit ribosomal protein L13